MYFWFYSRFLFPATALTCSLSGWNICCHQVTSDVWRPLMLMCFFPCQHILPISLDFCMFYSGKSGWRWMDVFSPKSWNARMFPVRCVLLTIFKPDCGAFVEDSYKRVTKLYSITPRNDRFIQAEWLLVKLAEDTQDRLSSYSRRIKAHK